MPDLAPFAVRAVAAIMDWHAAVNADRSGTGPGVGCSGLDRDLMTELVVKLTDRLDAATSDAARLRVSLRPTDGSIEQQVRRQLATWLRKEFEDSPAFENVMRELLDRARVGAAGGEPCEIGSSPSGPTGSAWLEDLCELEDAVDGKGGSSGATVRHSSARRDPTGRWTEDDDD